MYRGRANNTVEPLNMGRGNFSIKDTCFDLLLHLHIGKGEGMDILVISWSHTIYPDKS